jgi:hypothetical protein
MSILQSHHVEEIERILGRALSPSELEEAPGLDAVSGTALAVARQVMAESRPLAALYLHARVPGSRVGAVLTILEQLEARPDDNLG